MHVAKRVPDVPCSESAKLPKLGAFARFGPRHVGREFRAVVVGRALGDHSWLLRPVISRIVAAAARTSARVSTVSRDPAACPEFKAWAIWLRLLPTLLSAAVARARASALMGALRLARGPGVPNTTARI